MNDIEILEDIISEYKATAIEWKFGNVPVHLDERDIEAIKNLIQRNKDLEQIEQEHKKENGRLREELSQYKRIDKLVSNITPEEVDTAIKRASEQFIEVSKVEKELIQLNKDEKTELKGMKGQNKYFLKQQYAAKREILEKVLKMKGR